MGLLLTDEQLYKELTALMISVQAVTDGISKGNGTLGRLMNDPAAAKSLEASLDNLEAVTARIRAGEGSIGKLLDRRRAEQVADVDELEPGYHHRTYQQG